MLSRVIGVILFSAIAIQVGAQSSELELGIPAYGGNGCPAGTASVTVAPDQTAISILFDNFVAESGGETRKRLDRKSCNLTIPVKVPQGFSVAIFSVDYRGFNSVPRGGYSRFDAEYFWAGIRGPRTSETFRGPIDENYIHTDDVIAASLVWAPCGQSVNLRINSSMQAVSNTRMEQAMATVDSADITSGLIYHIQWRRCN